ncbi:DUF438 domain-containing protein [Desulfovibrio sp.]|uniref:DUF438 domain-containing protein n=1 Tax=Desulfovibrio sp. TaxID=885 RepID=UPI003D0FA0BB
MLLTKDASIYTLTKEYPFLIDALANHNKSFEKLKNPLLRQTVGRVASVEKAAGMGDESVLSLLLFIAGEIMTTTGESVEIAPPDARGVQGADTKTSQEQRLAALKEIIKDLHDGVEFSQLQDKFNKTVGDITPQEIAALEQTLVNEGLPETEIKRMCHLHAALFQNALEGQQMPQVQPGHPVHTYLKENAQAKKLIAEIREALGPSSTPTDAQWPFVLKRLSSLVQELAGIQTHYVRKENQLFPLLEKHDLSAPGKVMWEVHDDIRGKFRRAQELLADDNRVEGSAAVQDLIDEVAEMVRKEENILFPMCLQLLTEEDWNRCRLGDDEIGYSFGVTPEGEWSASAVSLAGGASQSGLVDLSTGQLPREVVDAILCNLPVDVSFVDPDDRVAYYSDSAHRIFPRSAAVIGREVKNCHPPKSVHMVTEILEAFKRGERDKAEFWLELGGKFIHIEYLALRNKQGAYLGCLEVGQDATHLRSLTGQRRLLEWE